MGTKQTRARTTQAIRTQTRTSTAARTTATQRINNPVPSYTVQFRQAIKKIRYAAAELALQDGIAATPENVYTLLSDIIDNAFDASQYVRSAEVVVDAVVSASVTPAQVTVPRMPYQQLGPDMLVDTTNNSAVAEWDEDELSLQMSADEDQEQAS